MVPVELVNSMDAFKVNGMISQKEEAGVVQEFLPDTFLQSSFVCSWLGHGF